MATIEREGVFTVVDENGNENVLFPETKGTVKSTTVKKIELVTELPAPEEAVEGTVYYTYDE